MVINYRWEFCLQGTHKYMIPPMKNVIVVSVSFLSVRQEHPEESWMKIITNFRHCLLCVWSYTSPEFSIFILSDCGRVRTFRMAMLPPSSRWWSDVHFHPQVGGKEVFRNSVILPYHYAVSQPKSHIITAFFNLYSLSSAILLSIKQQLHAYLTQEGTKWKLKRIQIKQKREVTELCRHI
jgi:hypothetical protein